MLSHTCSYFMCVCVCVCHLCTCTCIYQIFVWASVLEFRGMLNDNWIFVWAKALVCITMTVVCRFKQA